jgi:phosphoribosylglycinamide formyltransferase-1
VQTEVRWAFLISYNGNSACRTIQAARRGACPDCNISLMIYEQHESEAVALSRECGIPCLYLPRTEFSSDEEHQSKILDTLIHHRIDFVFLLGFDKIIGGSLLQAYHNRIVNVHASLLPSFKGRRPIERAIEYGVKVSGITTHFIDARIDRGIILFQEAISIKENETLASITPVFMEIGESIITQTINYLSVHQDLYSGPKPY